jgi:hypothetical protein
MKQTAKFLVFQPETKLLHSDRSDMFIALRAYEIFAEGAGGLAGCVRHGAPSERKSYSILVAINMSLLRRENRKRDLCLHCFVAAQGALSNL